MFDKDPILYDLAVLSGKNNTALQSLCKELGIKGYSKMCRAEMKIAIIKKKFPSDH